MCNPMAAVAVGSQAMGAISQRSSIRKSNARNLAVSQRNQSIIDADTMSQYAAIARREITEQRASEGQVRDNRRTILQAQAAARAEAGTTTGNSVDLVFQDFEVQRLASLEAARDNLSATSSELQAARENARRAQGGRTLQNQHVPTPQPNAVMTALQIGAAGVQGYMAGGGTFGATETLDPGGATNATSLTLPTSGGIQLPTGPIAPSSSTSFQIR